MRKQWIAVGVVIFGLVAISANAAWAMGKKRGTTTHRAPAKKHASLPAGQETEAWAVTSKEQGAAQEKTPAGAPASSQEHGGKEQAGAAAK